jgi:hypothetical protein
LLYIFSWGPHPDTSDVKTFARNSNWLYGYALFLPLFSNVLKKCPGKTLALFWSFRLQGFEGSKPLVNILLAGDRPVTHAVYGSAWRNWADWCLRRSEIYYSHHKAVSCCSSVSGSLSYSAIYVCFIGHITHATMEWRVRLLPFSISDERVGEKTNSVEL